MTNPVLVDCPADTWTKIISGVQTGQIHKQDETPYSYLCTHRDKNTAAPILKSEGVEIFLGEKNRETISSVVAIDIYIYAHRANGRVRVDL